MDRIETIKRDAITNAIVRTASVIANAPECWLDVLQQRKAILTERLKDTYSPLDKELVCAHQETILINRLLRTYKKYQVKLIFD